MPRRREHVGYGAMAILAFIYFFPDLNWFDYWQYAIAGMIGTVIPDILEPARSYLHRKALHSKRMLLICLLMIEVFLPFGLFVHEYCFFAVVFFAGYAFHLLLDATTKMGLPD